MPSKKKVKKSIYLTDQSSSQLKELVTWFEDRIGELEGEEDWMEENGENLLPSMRGLIAYLREEHLEEEDEPADERLLEEEDEEYEEEESDGELDF